MRFLVPLLLLVLATLGASAPVTARPAAADWLTTISRTPEGGVRMGNPNAKVKLIEYGSRSCPICGAFATAGFGPLREKYIATGQVSFEFRDFPVHPQDLGNAVIGRCVSDRNFFVILDLMYARQAEFNAKAMALTPAQNEQIRTATSPRAARMWSDWVGYSQLLRDNGMTQARIDQCFANPQALPSLGKLVDLARTAGAPGTPTFVINGNRAAGVVSWSQLEPWIQAALN